MSQKSHFWRFTKRNKDLCSQENLDSDIYSFIYNHHKLAAAQRPFSKVCASIHAMREKEDTVYMCSTEEPRLHILSERSQSLRSHTLLSWLWDVLEKAKLSGWRTDQWLPGWEVEWGLEYKGRAAKRIWRGDGRNLYLDCGGGYKTKMHLSKLGPRCQEE